MWWLLLPILLLVNAAPSFPLPKQFSIQAIIRDQDGVSQIQAFADKLNSRQLQITSHNDAPQQTYLWTYCDSSFDLVKEISYDAKYDFCTINYSPAGPLDDWTGCNTKFQGCSAMFKDPQHVLLNKIIPLRCIPNDLTFDKNDLYAYKAMGRQGPGSCDWSLRAYNLTASPSGDSYLPFRQQDNYMQSGEWEGRKYCVSSYKNGTFTQLSFQPPNKADIEVPLQEFCGISTPNDPPPYFPGTFISFSQIFGEQESYVIGTNPNSLKQECIFRVPFTFNGQYGVRNAPDTSKYLWNGWGFYAWLDVSTGKYFRRDLNPKVDIYGYSMSPNGTMYAFMGGDSPTTLYQLFEDRDPVMVANLDFSMKSFGNMFWAYDGSTAYLLSSDGLTLVTIDTTQWKVLKQQTIPKTTTATWDPHTATIYGTYEKDGNRLLSMIDATTGSSLLTREVLICTQCKWGSMVNCALTGGAPKRLTCQDYGTLYNFELSGLQTFQLGYRSYVSLLWTGGPVYSDPAGCAGYKPYP